MPRRPNTPGSAGTYSIDAASLQRIARRVTIDESRPASWRREVVAHLNAAVDLFNQDASRVLEEKAREEK